MVSILRLSAAVLLLVLLAGSVHSFSTGGKSPAADTKSCAAPVDRRAAFQSIFAATTFATTTALIPTPAQGKEIDPAIKGTKKDPGYEACMSQCIYDCTKPKGDEQKSRAECIPECKKKCATTKEQLMVGTPVKKE